MSEAVLDRPGHGHEGKVVEVAGRKQIRGFHVEHDVLGHVGVDPAANTEREGGLIVGDPEADLVLGVEIQCADGDLVQAAAGLQVRLLTDSLPDDEADSRFQIAPLLYLATRQFGRGESLRFRPYFNGGVTFDEDIRDTELRWGLGLACSINDVLTIATSFLGRHRVNEPSGTLGLLGRTDIVDYTIGGRVNLWQETLTAFAHAVLPVNDDGIRAAVIPVVGFEATF